ncbi:DUF2213 domain-containing protein [Providencia rettgeri]|uniref:Uncharacterized protein conserved in bacteria n=1 Tax=Providencia rettgeri TaxID=587 RepID=A0A379FTP1_PRORE|nr:DUF2213 domain-containing protein [Providencia rettgeri]QXB04725.1 DUF2213 domain-containing protein [Providencia rettgeri]SUC32012.1 Uncharacterized protein conserved in bacteria [Providencia rettgeri]
MVWKKTPQGYVVTTATITRAGPIEYYGHDIGLTGSDANKKITIIRTLDELSKPDTLKSFEGLPLTLTHPDSGEVTVNDHKEKAVGHIQNVRIEGDSVICDVYLTDANAIRVLEKTDVREVSVGYEPAEVVERNGELYQINIRGNHVAVVAEGRYGAKCRLNDKKGKRMKYGLKGIVKLLKGKNLKDANGEKLTQEELDQMIADLEAQLEEMKAAGAEDVNDSMKTIIDELERLKKEKEGEAKLNDAEGEPDSTVGDDVAKLKEQNAQLQSRVTELEAENSSLKEELERLKNAQSTETTLNDAKSRFPKVNLKDAKSERDIHAAVLVQRGVFNDSAVKNMTDEALRSAYVALQVSTKPRSDIGKHLFNDAKPEEPRNYTKQFGGK